MLLNRRYVRNFGLHINWRLALLFVLGLPSIFSLDSFAQQLEYKVYDSSNGLPNSNVWCIDQDQKGFLWLGTSNGLYRFDGKNYKEFGTEDGLLNKNITALDFDKDRKSLLIANYLLGVSAMDSLYKIQTLFNTSVSNYIDHNKDKVYSQSTSALKVFDLNTKVKKFFDEPGNFALNAFIINKENKVIIGSSNGLMELDDSTYIDLYPEITGKKNVRTVYEDPHQNLWFDSEKEFYCIYANGEIKKFPKKTISNRQISRFFMDSQDRIWLSVIGEGLFQLKNDELIFRGDDLDIGHTPINGFFEDREKNFWIATGGKGMVCLYNTYFTNYYLENGLVENQINDLYYDTKSKNLLIGTIDGLNYFDGNQLHNIELEKRGKLNYVRKIDKDDMGNLLVALNYPGDEYGLNKQIKIDNNNLTLLIGEFRSRKCWSFVGNNQIINFSNYGIQYFNFEQNAYIPKKISRKPKWVDYQFTTILQGQKTDTWWVGSKTGLFNYANNELKPLADNSDSSFPNALKSAEIKTMIWDHAENLWIGSNEGLFKFNGKNWKRWTKKDGMPDDYVSSILQDASGNFWIGTSRGLVYFDGNFTKFDINDGLPSNQISSMVFNGDQSQLWIGTNNGLSKLDLKKMRSDSRPSIIMHLENITLGDSILYPELVKDAAVFNYDQNHLVFNFSAPYLTNSQSLKYQYRLDNAQEWKDCGAQQIELASLSPKKYNFQIRSKSNINPWSETSQFQFDIKSPWWKTKKFFAACLLLVAGLVALISKLRIDAIRKKTKDEISLNKKMYLLEQQALSAMMNPHFIFNALNSVQYYINTNKKREANEYLAKLARLIRMNLEIAQSSAITLEEELERLILFLELQKLRFGKKLNWSVDIDDKLDSEELLVPSMVIQVFVENAILHGILPKEKGGEIKIGVYPSGEQAFLISIEDDGIGIFKSQAIERKEKKHNSKGITISKERIKNFGYPNNQLSRLDIREIIDASGSVAGTKVSIRLPISES